jgi:enoyl-CoA hydratase
MSGIIKTARDGMVATITIDRGAEGNQLTIDLIGELSSAFRAASASDASVITLQSTGADFCRGRDPRGEQPTSTALAMRKRVVDPILDLYDAIGGTRQPIVCAVQGAALGFGCALSTACDITFAADDSRFRLPELEKSLPPTLAISAMMSRVPRKALTWMVYSTKEIAAERALQLGIVSSVVPSAQLRTLANELVAELTNRSPESLVAVKDYMRSAPAMDPRGAADYAASLISTVVSSSGR